MFAPLRLSSCLLPRHDFMTFEPPGAVINIRSLSFGAFCSHWFDGLHASLSAFHRRGMACILGTRLALGGSGLVLTCARRPGRGHLSEDPRVVEPSGI
jgi:hypothetical protein